MNANGTTAVKPVVTPKPLGGTSPAELQGYLLCGWILKHISDRKGQFLRDSDGSLHVILDDRRIPLRYERDNGELAELIFASCGISTLSAGVQASIQRLQVEASHVAGPMQLRQFSALSEDQERLYIPTADGKLLQLTAGGIESVPNGENQDHFWVEHPYSDPLIYSPSDSSDGLAIFDRLLVETQACLVPSMRWLVAMHAAFFPFVRNLCLARFLLELIGGTQQGKTSGARRFTLLHGLGDVKGDFTVAALAALGDIGLLVLDNKEQANFTQPLIDHCLFLATSGEHGRAQVDGRLRPSESGRPVGIITTIEGVVKTELRARCVQVQYGVTGQSLPRGPIEHEIGQRRHEIGSAMIRVLQRFLSIRSERRPTPNPIPQFEEHFTALADLLRAFGQLAGKPLDWSEKIITDWNTALLGANEDEDDLEHLILRALNEFVSMSTDTKLTEVPFTYNNVAGRLYVTEAASLLTLLQKLNIRTLTLPQNAQGLSRRLKSGRFQEFTFLPTDAPDVSPLKRTGRRRPIGFFRPDA